ncbi:MAG: DUF4446 family protein [Patescibacteria group bacterium]|jgi:hypothetical protein
MSFFVYLIILLNLFWSLYLTYLVYKKNLNKIKAKNDNSINLSEASTTVNKCLQKVTLTRFNPFDDLGGNQSFILCLLDKSNSGVIITSLHNRDTTRLYAKTIVDGQGDGVTLSKDEKTAILKTIKV